MRGKVLVIGLTFGVLSAACYYHRPYGYRYGYGYSGGYYQQPTYTAYSQPQSTQQQVVVEGQTGQATAVVQTQAPPPAQGVSVTATATVAGEGIAGSDGTRGWRVAVQQPQAEFQRLAQVAARANCQVESSNANEVRAVCGGNVHIMVRFDQQHVYKLCAPNTDPNMCAQVWSSFGG